MSSSQLACHSCPLKISTEFAFLSAKVNRRVILDVYHRQMHKLRCLIREYFSFRKINVNASKKAKGRQFFREVKEPKCILTIQDLGFAPATPKQSYSSPCKFWRLYRERERDLLLNRCGRLCNFFNLARRHEIFVVTDYLPKTSAAFRYTRENR